MKRKRVAQCFPWLAMAVAGVCLLSFNRIEEPAKREFPVLAALKVQEQAEVGPIERKIQKKEQQKLAQEQKAADLEERRERLSPRERFETAVLVGDSIAEGYIDYEILDPESIVAKKGIRTDTAGPEIEKALSLSPGCIFLSIGMNDLEYCRGSSELFAERYRELLTGIREADAKLPIYVNGILPILPEAVEKKPVMGNVDVFNEALRAVCEELDIVYIDSSDLLEGKEEWYQKDAIHLKSPFYPLWLERMEEMAGL